MTNTSEVSKPLVSIVVPNFNTLTIIDSCVENFLKISYEPLEIIFVDDYSTDGSYEKLETYAQKHPKIKVYRNAANSGPSKTRNKGIQHAEGKYIALLETDMQVEPDYLDYLIAELEADETLGAVQSKVLDLNKKDIVSADGIYYDPHTFWVICKSAGMKDSEAKEANRRKYCSIGAVGSVIRKDVLAVIGGYDELIVHNIDDIDLGWRIWLYGKKIKYIPQAVTYHWTAKPANLRSKTTPSVKSEMHFQKTIRIFLKNYEWQNVIRYAPTLYMVFVFRIFTNLLAGNTAPLQGFVKALVWTFKTLPDTMKERKRLQALRGFSDSYIFENICRKGSFLHIYKKDILPMLRRAQTQFLS